MSHRTLFATVVAVHLASAGRAQAADSLPTPAEEEKPEVSVAFPLVEGESSDEAARRASEEAVKKEASERFRKGIGFYEEGDYRLALIEFERAYELVPNYRVLFNIGQVAISLGRFAKARIAFERYLEEAGDSLDLERRLSVEKDLNMLRGRTATLEVRVVPEGAELLIDESLVGTSPIVGPLVVDAGEHRLKVRRRGFLTLERSFRLGGGESLDLELNLEKEPEAPKVVVVERPSGATETKPSNALNTWRWVGWTVSGVLVGGAVATGLVGGGKAGELNELKASPDPNPRDLTATADDAKTWLMASDVLAIAAGTTLATSFVLQLYRPKAARERPASKPTVDVSASPFSLGVHVSGAF